MSDTTKLTIPGGLDVEVSSPSLVSVRRERKATVEERKQGRKAVVEIVDIHFCKDGQRPIVQVNVDAAED